MYYFDDVSRKFWLKLKDTLISVGMKVMPRDEAYYHMHEEGECQCSVLTHVDDFVVAGKENFVEKIRLGIAEVLTVTKVERDKFRFTG